MTLAARQSLSPQARHDFAIVTAAVLIPLGHLSYLAALFWLQGYPHRLDLEPIFSTSHVLYLTTVALTGVIVYLDWNWGLRIAPVAAVGALLVYPFTFHASIGAADYGWLPFATVLIATGLEGFIRFPDRVEQLATRSVWRYALAVGLLHFVLGFSLQLYARHGLPGAFLLMPPIAVSALGLVATGALPVLMWTRHRLVLPAITTAGWFLWGLYGTWAIRHALPWGDFEAINWYNPQPYPDYMLKWTVLMVALLTVAGCELAVRRAGRHLDDGDAQGTT